MCLLRNLQQQVKKQQLELDMEQWTGSKLGKEYIKAVHCHSANLTHIQSTSCEMLGGIKLKLESSFLGEISITSDMQMTPPLWQKVKRNQSFIILFLLIYLFLAVLGLHCCMGFSLGAASGNYSIVQVCGLVEQGLQSTWASVAGGSLQSTGSTVVAHGLSCFRHVGSSWIRDGTRVSGIGRQNLYH